MPDPAQDIRFCTSRDGTRIAYATCGAGPPVLFAPHWVHHLEYDWGSQLWRPWLCHLTRQHTVIRFDWRGCGLSDRDGVAFSVEDYINDFEAVVEAVALDRFPLIGVSNGAIFGAAYAARHPGRVSRLVLQSCQSRGRLGRNPRPEQVEILDAWLKVIELGWPNEDLAYGQFFVSLHLPDANTEQRKAFSDMLNLTTSPANAVGLIKTFARADICTLLPEIACPTLVLHSRADSLITFDDGRNAASLIPGARFVPLESRNHIPLDSESAWRQVIEAIDDFMPRPVPAARPVLDDLTAREHDVLELVAQGLDNTTIGRRLGISERTARNHVSNIVSKLGAGSRARAIVRAREAGFGQKTSR
jgi:pimeloyl-ACP methyl ester carboxylesterase/DNA-binding CsgD family transcriptional regulator